MNTRYYMVIIKGEIKTSEIMSCGYNRNTQKWDVKFNTGKIYSYAYLNVEKLTEPEVLNPDMYRISREGREFFDVKAIYVFRSRYESYWHICFGNGSERDYHRSELNIVESCLTHSQSSNVFEYIKQIAGLSNLKNEETGEKLLSKRFDKISFVGNDVALAKSQSVQNATYEQKDPLLIYKLESFQLFSKMLNKVNADVLSTLNKAYIPVRENTAENVQRERQERAKVDVNKLQASRMQAAAQAGQAEKQKPMPVHVEKKAGRNDPCPCGSGKKYKNCHGKGL